MTPGNARMFIQSNRPSHIQRAPESRVRIGKDWSVGGHGDRSAHISQFRLRDNGQVWLSAHGASRPTACKIQEIEPDRVGNMG